MRKIFCLVAFFLVSALLIPIIMHGIVPVKKEKNEEKIEKSISEETIDVFFCDENIVKTVLLEEYLCNVVAAEMPAEFETEALKAQAVAARSYAVYKKSNPSPDHPGAAICTDYTHCKAYKSEQDLEMQWGENKETFFEKIKNAVSSTCGEVLTYNGEVALAVFHSQSANGRTESSKDVWGGEIPYLVSVESYGEETAPNFYSTVTVPFEEFAEKINSEFPNAELSSFDDIGYIQKSDGGNVKEIYLGKTIVSGKDIRRLFNLRSSCFTVSFNENNVVFEVSGYGHGVGMSQYGANSMAKDGSDYRQILTHYYTGTKVESV